MAEHPYLGTADDKSSPSGAERHTSPLGPRGAASRFVGNLGISQKGATVLYSDDSTTKLSHQCSLSVERRIDRLTFGLHGEFDLSCGETFLQALAGAIDDRVTELIVDLHGLSFIDSAGVKALLYLRTRAERDGFDFVVLCGEGHVMRVLKLTGLDELLPVVNPSAVLPGTNA